MLSHAQAPICVASFQGGAWNESIYVLKRITFGLIQTSVSSLLYLSLKTIIVLKYIKQIANV